MPIPGAKLLEACQQQQFNRSVEDVERWLNDIESSLISEDYGKVRQGGVYLAEFLALCGEFSEEVFLVRLQVGLYDGLQCVFSCMYRNFGVTSCYCFCF